MEENTDTTPNLWNKKADDLTVADNLKLSLGLPIALMVAVAGPLWVAGVIAERRANRQLQKLKDASESSDIITPDEVTL